MHDTDILHQNNPRISLVIPHFNDLENLDQCLESIEKQTCDKEMFEVIICDNNSEHFEIDEDKYSFRLISVVETTRGAAAARNAGVEKATGTYVAFTDCDCYLDPDFLKNGLERINTYDKPVVMLGEVIIQSLEATPTPVEAFEIIFLMDQEKCARNGDGATGNLWTSKKLFEQVGNFRSGIAEDTDWCKRAAEAGASFTFAENCIVYHPARTTLHELRDKWNRQSAMTYNIYRKRPYFPIRWLLLILMTLASPFIHSLKALRSDRLEKIGDRAKAVPVLFWCRFFRARQMIQFLIKNQDSVDPVQFWG